jgi:cytochrome c551/c552
MRRPSVLGLVLLAALTLLATACSTSKPGGKLVTPTPTKIVGPVPKAELPGKSVFLSQGCGACHTFKSAGSTGKVGPDLDKLAQYAKAANQGPLQAFVRTSITTPGAYVEKGYPNGVMPTTYSSLSAQQLSDLVAFLTQKS